METALLKLVNDLLCSADEGKVSVLALLDLSSAFDTIDHEVLLKRLHDTYGIEGTVLNWFHSYLSERTKSVSFCGCASRAHQLLYGVPQGSVLGPVLFTLYTQPLASVIWCHDVLYHFYADDTELHSSCPPAQLNVMCYRLSFCMDDIKGWTIKNKLKLNEDKTEAMVLGNLSVLSGISRDSIVFAGCLIPFPSQVKSLGVTLDSALSMKQRINTVCRACYFHIRYLKLESF